MRAAITPVVALALLASTRLAAAQVTEVPTDVQLPGTQPGEAPPIDGPGQCLNCHAGYDAVTEPGRPWQGSMMAHAARDPLFWASVAVAEGDFPGAGDLCLRCHTPIGWLGGRSTPTDGSALNAVDAEGVSCTLCHLLVNPDGSEHGGIQHAPFLAHDGGTPPTGWYGSSEMVVSSTGVRLGPYADAVATHQTAASDFHRDSRFCATCHDVSNPVTGDLAPGNGALTPLPPGTFSGAPGGPVDGKAGFGHAPFAYGVLERTSSEHAASAFAALRVSQYGALPAELQAGAIEDAWLAAMASTPSGDYADGDPRTFSCQTCHMPPATGKGCDKNYAPVRTDIPRHTLNGANTWVPGVIQWLDAQGALVLGGGLTAEQVAAMDVGVVAARAMLRSSASLSVVEDTARVVNLTGHKLPTGYPEGRRLWLNVRWLGPAGQLVREDGAYGSLDVEHEGQPLVVESLLDLADPHLRLWGAHLGLTQAWAAKLLGLGFDPALPIAYDRFDGSVETTLGELAAAPPGTARESFRFVLNDTVVKDTRIPPYGMDRDAAFERNCQPVPDDQYGGPAPGGAYLHFDEFDLDPAVGAATAELRVLYQTTSWEYVQFLALADPEQSAFLGQPGDDLLAAWLANGMSPPEEVVAATWTATPGDCDHDDVADAQEIALGAETDCDGDGTPDACQLAVDPAGDLDGDGGLDVCQWLSADVASVSLAAGGAQSLALHAGPQHAGDLYWLLGSTTGTSPGLPVGPYVVPLVPDAYFQFTLSNPNQPPLSGSLAVLGAGGVGTATVTLPAGASPSLAGITAWHAFVALELGSLALTGVSNPVSLTLVP